MATAPGRSPATSTVRGGAHAALIPLSSAACGLSCALAAVAAAAAAAFDAFAVLAAIGLLPPFVYYRELDRRSEQ